MKMKKTQIIILAATAAVLAAAGITAGVYTGKAVRAAEAAQAAVYAEYQELLAETETAELTVTEGGALVGSYGLAELGVLEAAKIEVSMPFGVYDCMEPSAFQALSLKEKLSWNKEEHPADVTAALPMMRFDPAAVLEDLAAMPRAEAKDAYLSYENGVYEIHDEVPGNVLREEAVREALRKTAAGMTFGGEETPHLSLELTDTDCYFQPEITVANGGFDMARDLTEALSDDEIRVVFHTGEEVLSAEALRALVSIDKNGALQLDEEGLSAYLSAWAETYRADKTPYLFDSYVSGPVPIEFLMVRYELDTQSLRDQIWQKLVAREGGEIEAPYFCYDKNDEPFSIDTTYIEVDIQNQQMTYYKDGELIVNTDVVTGRVSGYKTPTGLYYSHDRRPDRWLIGEDYAVFVKYWVRIWNAYGIHDASWRTKFGGDNYIYNGSHGCVNTPEAAMEKIYANIEDGTPVLVF